MDIVKIKNTNTGKECNADVLQRSDKRLRVVLTGTSITLTLTRSDTRRAFVGYYNTIEFTSMG